MTKIARQSWNGEEYSKEHGKQIQWNEFHL